MSFGREFCPILTSRLCALFPVPTFSRWASDGYDSGDTSDRRPSPGDCYLGFKVVARSSGARYLQRGPHIKGRVANAPQVDPLDGRYML